MLPAAMLMLASLAVPHPAYNFIADTDRLVSFFRAYGERRYYVTGRFDAEGRFIENRRYEVYPPIYVFTGSGDETIEHLSFSRRGSNAVYEFRSGKLVPGTIDWGQFTPDPNGKPIRFADYQYSPIAKVIWNLPGYFRDVRPLTPKDAPDAALSGAASTAGRALTLTHMQLSIQNASGSYQRSLIDLMKSRR